MWMSGLWMGPGSQKRGSGWLDGNLELILSDNTYVHAVASLTDGSLSLC